MNMKPHPPPTLSKEFTRVWIGWCAIGDREVAREAAAKGIYISLALQFIATRKEWDHSDVERWFKSEILTWVYQLLDQRQIFKASHILSNIGLDPPDQLSNILLETNNKQLRDYIAEHLAKTGKLESALLNTWNFIKAIENSNVQLPQINENISQTSMQNIDQKPREWKSQIATVLFFNNYDFCLETFLTAEAAWKFLLTKEKCAILKLWINVYFAKDYEFTINLDSGVVQKLKNLFLLWPITREMINEIQPDSSYSDFIKNFVLNELAIFGIFTDDEKTDVSIILSRFSRTQNIQNIHNILQEPTSYLNITEFYEKLNYFCVTHELYELLSSFAVNIKFPHTLIHSKQLSLWLTKPDTTQNTNNTEVLLRNIVTALHYFADDNIVRYLTLNPIILLAIIVFTKEKLSEIIAHKKPLTFDSITLKSETIFDCFNDLPVLQTVITKFLTHTNTNTVNLYQLFGKHTNLTALFRDNGVPHFGSAKLCIAHGYIDNVNYLYYLKQKRPGKAAKIFLLDKFRKNGDVTDSDKEEVMQNISKLALNNCNKSDIVSSCISFAEILGLSTQNLRVLITVFNEIKSTNYDLNKLCQMFSNILENSAHILDIYEGILLEKCDKNNFDSILANHEIGLQFAVINNLQWPTKFLLHCAKHNLYLPFTIFIQVFHYPVDQILKIAAQFENKVMAEHLAHALSSDIGLECDDTMTSSSLSLLARSISSQISVELDNAESGGAICDFQPKSDLLKVLIKCHKSGDPPTALLQACQHYKNPLLAILATCYEPDSVVINWLAWLSISAEIKIDLIENYAISASAVSGLLQKVLRKEYSRTLLESLKIFLPENPLHSLVEFLHNCVLLNFETSTKYLSLFEKQIRHLNYNTVIPTNDFEYTFLTNSYWLIETALKLIFATLGYCFRTRSHQIMFLNTLCQAELAKNVPIECPNFCNISQLVQQLASCEIDLNLGVFFNADACKSEVIRCIEILVAKRQFEHALELAQYENLCVDYVLNEEWTYKFKHQFNDNFWTECETSFIAANITPCSAAEFYIYCSKILTGFSEKYRVIKLAYEWLKKSDYSDQFVENIEQEIWTTYFALDDATLHGSRYEKHERNYLLNEILERSNASSRLDNALDEEQMRHLEETVGKILESGDIIEAVRLAKMFKYKNAEIEILLTCYELAEGKLRPYEISAEQRLLFLNRDRNLRSLAHRRRTVKSRLSNMSTSSYDSAQTMVPIVEQDEPSLQDTLALLETMTDRLKHGNNIGGRILMCYRIAVNVNKPYQDIVKHTDSFQLLKQALENDCSNKLEVAHDVFVIFKWSKTEITDFIFDELKAAINISIEQNLECILMWDLNLDTNFHLILQLCNENSSILGEKLLSLTNTIQLTEINTNSVNNENVNVLIELLIRAHDCFNTYCNMEGIAAVLRKSQTITSILLNHKLWRQMVRLLTGIGRYTEMNYIFQILKENDQFEYLLKRSFRKDHGLKVALLKFLKKHCPKNQDLYRIVALHFTLFSEVAQLWENEAMEMTNNLIEIAKLEVQNQGRNFELQLVLFTNNASTVLCLNKVMSNYSHAAEYHVHGEKLKQAMKAAKQAELVALQIAMLKCLPQNASANCILKLDEAQVMALVNSDLSFTQAKILIDAYTYTVDWGAIIYHQCIHNAKLHYLDEFLTSKPLTNTLAQDLTRRFLADSVHTQMSVRAMKEVLKRLGSVHMRYRLASEMGFNDVIETLLAGSQLAYLKDTVWKKGYKQL